MSNISSERFTIVDASSSSSSTLKVEVKGYHVNGDVSDFNSHMWSLDIKLDSIAYLVDRSYVDFVDLDRRLRKKYPKSIAVETPLASSHMIQKQLNKEVSKASSGSSPNPTKSAYAQQMKLRSGLPAFAGAEDIAGVTASLNSYVNALLCQHQIIACGIAFAKSHPWLIY